MSNPVENGNFVGLVGLSPDPTVEFADAHATHIEDVILAAHGIGLARHSKFETYAMEVILAEGEAQTDLEAVTAPETITRHNPSGTTQLEVASTAKLQQQAKRRELKQLMAPYNPELVKLRIDKATGERVPLIPSSAIYRFAGQLGSTKGYRTNYGGVLRDNSIHEIDYTRALAFRLGTQLNNGISQDIQDKLLVRGAFNQPFALNAKALEELLSGLEYGDRIDINIGYMEHAMLEEVAANVRV